MRKVLLMFMVSLFVMSCSKVPEEREVTASNVEVSGFIKDYIKVVDGSYKFTNNGKEGQVTVKLKLKAQPSEAYHVTNFPKIRINAIGKSGEIFDTGVYGFEAAHKEFDKVKELLSNGNIDDTKSVSFTWHYLGINEDLGSKIFNEATGFELIDDGFAAGEKPEKSTSIHENTEEGEDYDAITEEHRLNEMSYLAEESETKSDINTSDDYDKLLDEYEDYFNAILKLSKKAKNNDPNAYVEYTNVMQKAQSVVSKLNKANGHLSPSQQARLAAIITKFSTQAQLQ